MAPPNVNRWTTDPEYIELLNYLIGRTENVKSPISIKRMARELKETSEAERTERCFEMRLIQVRTRIHTLAHLDTNTRVKMIFALSASVDADFLKKLKKDAIVEVDEKKRITHYKANDGSLELKGDHSPSAKNRAAKLDAKRSHQNLIRGYFENKNKADAVPKSEEERELWNLINFITEKCEDVNSPLNIHQVTKDFKKHFGISQSFTCINNRLRKYSLKIQEIEFLDTHSKVKQLFGLSVKLDSDFLKELRKTAVVEVDHKNRITKYTANDNSLTLRGNHWGSGMRESKRVDNSDSSEEESDIEGLDDSSDEYSSEEFDSDLNSDDEIYHQDETEDLTQSSKETDNFDNENTVRNRLRMSLRSHRSEEFEMREDDGRKRKNSSPIASTSEKKRNKGTTGSSSNNSMRPNELDDYDTNDSIDDQDLNEVKRDEQILEPPQAPDEHNQIEEVPVEVEHEEPESSHNPKIKFFEAIQSLILCLNIPSLSSIQSKINENIEKIRGPDEVILNDDIVLMIDLLIARLNFYSVENLSKDVESVNLSSFLCYLKAAIQISRMSGVEDLVENISELIENSQNKRIPVEAVSHALCATLDIDGP